MSFKNCVSLLIFYVDDLSISISAVLKFPTLIVLQWISPFIVRSWYQDGYQNAWDTVKVLLREKFMVVNTWDEGFPCTSVTKESVCNAGDLGLIPGSGRSPGERNGNPLQYLCLGNPMDRGAGRLQSMGSQRVGHNLATKPSPHTWRLRDYLWPQQGCLKHILPLCGVHKNHVTEHSSNQNWPWGPDEKMPPQGRWHPFLSWSWKALLLSISTSIWFIGHWMMKPVACGPGTKIYDVNQVHLVVPHISHSCFQTFSYNLLPENPGYASCPGSSSQNSIDSKNSSLPPLPATSLGRTWYAQETSGLQGLWVPEELWKCWQIRTGEEGVVWGRGEVKISQTLPPSYPDR